MKAQDFLELVGEMLMAQQQYFHARTQSALVHAKRLEKQVLAVVKEGRLEPDELDTSATERPTEVQGSLFIEGDTEQ